MNIIPCLKRCIAGLALLLFTLPMWSQQHSTKDKDSVILGCLLYNAKEPPAEKPAIDLGTTELKLVLTSNTDTVVKAPIDAVVSTVQREADGTWEVVFYHQDYWFWLSGLTTTNTRPKANLKPGQPIGTLAPGRKLELLMFDFETPVDPKNYMRCNQSK